jgi:hypothetical protein
MPRLEVSMRFDARTLSALQTGLAFGGVILIAFFI